MAETFRCPACSAPLEFEGKMMQKCAFCQSNVIVPANVMQNSDNFGGAGLLNFGDVSNLTGKALKLAEIQKLIQSGNKIHAIKLFRETFGGGLKEAKDAVDAMEAGKSVDISGITLQASEFVKLKPNKQFAGQNSSIWWVLIIVAFFIFVFVVFFLTSQSGDNISVRTNNNLATPKTPVPANKTEENPSIAQEILKFGGEGIGAGKFKDNRTIAVDPNGRIFSADYSGGRTLMFDKDGNFQIQITSDTTKTVDALGTDRKGNLFILQGYDLHRFKAENGESLGKTRIDYASDLAIGLDGKIYVSTRRGEIQILNAEGNLLNTIKISKDLNLDYIERLTVDGKGNFFALDGKNIAIFKLSPEGKLLTRFGGRSTESGDKMPKGMFQGRVYDMAVDSQGRLYASQVSRISIFDENGNYLNEFKTTQAFGMDFNDADEMFVAARPFVMKYKLNF